MPGVIVRLWPLSWFRGLQGQVNPLASSENHCSKDLFRARRRRLPFEPFLFLVQLRVPVQHNGHRPDVHVLDLRVDQKSLPILAEADLQQAGSGRFPAQTHQGSGERSRSLAFQLHGDKARIVILAGSLRPSVRHAFCQGLSKEVCTGLMRSERTATGTSRPFSELLEDPCAARMRYHLNATPGGGPCSVHFPSSIFHPFSI